MLRPKEQEQSDWVLSIDKICKKHLDEAIITT